MMWKTLRVLVVFLCAQACHGQVNYRADRDNGQDVVQENVAESADFGNTLQKASTAINAAASESGSGEMLPEGVLSGNRRLPWSISISIKITITFRRRMLRKGRMFSKPTRLLTDVVVTDPVNGSTTYYVDVDIATSGEGVAMLELTETSQLNDEGTGLCDECTLIVQADKCLSGDCGHYDMKTMNRHMKVQY